MGSTPVERRYSPLIILMLVAALVVTLGLWATERAGAGHRNTRQAAAASGGAQYHWKMVTTWPTNFPGLGMAPEVLSRSFASLVPYKVFVRGSNVEIRDVEALRKLAKPAATIDDPDV